MRKIAIVFTVLVVLSAVGVRQSVAKPLSRGKRTSDQRLAELETLIALDSLKGKLITVPVGGGLNPNKIGRRRRADETFLTNLFNASDEDIDSNLLDAEEELEAESEAKLALLAHLHRLQQAQRLHSNNNIPIRRTWRLAPTANDPQR